VEQWIRDTLSADQLGLTVLPAAFLFGLLGSVGSCCTVPVLGAVAGYAGTMTDRQERRPLLMVSLSFMVGTIVSLAALGAVAGFIGQAAGSSLGRYWRVAAGMMLVIFGVITLDLLPLRLPRIRLGNRKESNSVAGALVCGLALGGGSTACSLGCNPLIPMAMGAAVLKGATLMGVAMLGFFAVGYSLPLAAGLVGIGFGLGRLDGLTQRAITVVRIVGGTLLIAIGFYLLAGK